MTVRPIDAVLLAISVEDARQYPEFPPRMVVTTRTAKRLRGRKVRRVYMTPAFNKTSTTGQMTAELLPAMLPGYAVVILPI